MILFTADWHLKLGQKNIPKKWAMNRYYMLFEQIAAIECDMHIIGGDLFDRRPSMEELQLYFEFITGVKVPTVIYPGNHESTSKYKTFLSYLIKATNRINPLVSIVDTPYYGDAFGILPYNSLHEPKTIETFNGEKPLFTHVRGEIPPHVKPEVDLERFNKFPVVFAGDLHAHSNSQRNIVYPGSPLTTSFHRTEVSTGYLLIEGVDWTWYKFNLPQLLRKTVDNSKDMVATEYHHTIYEVEGDMQELSKISNSELLDKKVVKRTSEAALVLSSKMTITDELSEYLLYILELPEDKVKNIIGTYYDYKQR